MTEQTNFSFDCNQVDSSITSDERTLAIVAHLLSFIEGGIIGPLIIYLVKKDSSRFVAFHALQSLYFGLLFIGVFLITLITCIGPIICAIFYFIYEVVACIRAGENKWYRLPLAGNWAMKSHPPPSATPPPQVQYPQQNLNSQMGQ